MTRRESPPIRKTSTGQSRFRSAVRLETLERRNLLAVTSQLLADGLLDIRFDASKDTAEVSVDGGRINVTAEGNTNSFDLNSIRAISASSVSGEAQSIQFGGDLSLRESLRVEGIATILLASGNYQIGSATIVAPGTITIQDFTLSAEGEVRIEASQTLDETEAGLLGFLGVVVEANSSILLNSSSIFGTQIDVVARVGIDANADGDDDEDTGRDFARVKAIGEATIVISGDSTLQARGPLAILAESLQTIDATAIAHPTGNDASREAALALANVTSTATIEIKDQTAITAGEEADIQARNIVTVVTAADGALAGGGGKGATVSSTEFFGLTAVLITDTVSITAANINTEAEAEANITTTAKSTVGGATENSQSTQQQLQNSGAQTSSGGLGLAGAFANTKSERITEVIVSGTVSLRANDNIDLASSMAGTTITTADGKSTNNAGNEGDGVGVAVAIDRATHQNRAVLDGTLSVTATQLNVNAVSSNDSHTTTANSGAGAAEVGVAGGFARTVLETVTESILADGATLVADGTNVAFRSESKPSIESQAVPAGNTQGETRGIGASVAMTRLDNQTVARVGEQSQVTAANALTLQSTVEETVATNAVTGVEGGSANSAGVATAVIESNAIAELGNGALMNLEGNLLIDAKHIGNVNTTVAGDVAGETAARGGSFALNDVQVNALATLSRSLQTSGAVDVNSSSGGAVNAEAKSSVTGSPETEQTADQQALAEQQAAGSNRQAPSADAQGKVSAAAASAINLVDAHARSTIDREISVDARQTVTLQSSNSMDAIAKADSKAVGSGTTNDNGDTTGGTERGRGIAVSINRANVSSEAQIGELASVTGQSGISVSATSTTDAEGDTEDSQRLFAAEAVSGAGGRKTGFAGSFALNRVDNHSLASVGQSATLDVGQGSLQVRSNNSASQTAKATPSGSATGEVRGVGISFALNIANNLSSALLENESTVSSDEDAGEDTRSIVTAESTQTVITEAKGGSGSETNPGEKALTPVFAIQSVDNTTTAEIRSQSVNVAGAFQLLADATVTSTVNAEGSAVAENAARGIVVAMDLSDSVTDAQSNASIVVGGDVAVQAKADVTQSINAKASAKGGDINPSAGGADQEAAKAKQAAENAGAKRKREGKSIKTPDGPVTFAGALALGISDTITTASIGDDSEVTAGGSLSVQSTARDQSTIKADATALTVAAEAQGNDAGQSDPPDSDASGRGVGVAIAVHDSHVTTTAEIGSGAAIRAVGVSVASGTGSEAAHQTTVEAVSGAGGGEVGNAGSFAMSILRNMADARIRASKIDAGADDVSVKSNNDSSSTVSATPSSNASGSKRGRGVSFALNVTKNTTTAEVEENALIRQSGTVDGNGARNLTVEAKSNHTVTTEAKGGAGAENDAGEKSVTPVFAIANPINKTMARAAGSNVGTSRIAGNATITAEHTGSATTKAEGAAIAEDTAVGLALGLGIAIDEVTAEIDDRWSAVGNVVIRAQNTATSSSESKASSRGGDTTSAADDAKKKKDAAKKEIRDADGQVIDEDIPDDKLKTPDGSMSVAGALAVNVHLATTLAHQASGSLLNAQGSLSIDAQAQVKSKAKADASAVTITPSTTPPADDPIPDPSQTGVGVAISGNFAKVRTVATIEGNSETQAAHLSVNAGTAASGEADHEFSSEAVSGAGVDKVGRAGSLAVNFVNNDSDASIGPNAQVALPGSDLPENVTDNKNLKVVARNEVSNLAKATSSVTNSPTKGVGPAIVANIADNSSMARIDDAASLTTTVNDLTVEAIGDYRMVTQSSSGTTAQATAAGEGGRAISPALSASFHRNTTHAYADSTQLFGSLTVDGNLLVQATHTSATGGNSEATVNASGESAVGMPVVVNLALDDAEARISGSFSVTGAADVLANSDIAVVGDASSSVSGARGDDEEAATIKQRAQDYLDDLREEVNNDRSKILDVIDERYGEAKTKFKELADADPETHGIAASGVGNLVFSNTVAEVAASLNATGAVNIVAESDRDITATADSLAASPSFASGRGGALAVNIAQQTILAHAFGQSLTGETIKVEARGPADNSHLVKARALAGGGSKESGKAGSIGMNFVGDDVRASVGVSPLPDAVQNTNVTAEQGLSILATSDLEIQNIAGAGALGFEDDSTGGALAVNGINSTTEALTGPSTTINNGGKLLIEASSNIEPTKNDVFGDPIALAAAGSAAGDDARAGAAAINVFLETTRAAVGEDNTINTTPFVGPRFVTVAGDISIAADSTTELRAGAGAIALALDVGKGIGVAANIVTKDVTAELGDNSSLDAAGSLSIDASSVDDIFSIAAAPSLGGSTQNVNFGGAIQATSQVSTVTANVGENATVEVRDDMHVQANHDVDAELITGAVSGTTNKGFAGSLSLLSLLNRTEAAVFEGSELIVAGPQGLTVLAEATQNVIPVAVGGTGGGGTSAAGSATLTRINTSTFAHLDDQVQVTARDISTGSTDRPNIVVRASDDTVFKSGAGVVAVGKKGLGGSVDATRLVKDTKAFVGGGTTLDAAGNIVVDAQSTEDILSVAGSVSVSAESSITGAMSGHSLDVTTQAVLGDNLFDDLPPSAPATAHANGTVMVSADDRNEMDFLDGNAGLSGGTSIGGAANVAVVRKLTEAKIAEQAVVNADALATVTPVTVKSGKFDVTFSNSNLDQSRVIVPDLDKDVDGDGQNDLTDSSILGSRLALPVTEQKRGVFVTATNRDDIASFVVGGGLSNGFGFAISTPAAILRVDTAAKIGANASVNSANQENAGTTQDVMVSAASDYSHLGLSGALAIAGGAGVAPAGNIESTKMNTIAAIENGATVAARRDVVVQANATEDSLLLTASGTVAGGAGVSGSVAVFALNNTTHASIGADADVDAGGNVFVSASDITDLDAIAGAAALGAGAGVSVSSGIHVIHKDTQAFIHDDAQVDAKANSTPVEVLDKRGSTALLSTTVRGVVVQAHSKENLLSVAAGGGASTGVAGAGSVNINIVDSDTSAYIGDGAQINTQVSDANGQQSIHVVAGNEIDARAIAGGIAVGAGALAGSADIGVVRNDTTSFIGNAAELRAEDDIMVQSLASEEIDSLAISGGLALTASFAAAVSVWTLGTQFDPSYSDDKESRNSLENGDSSVDQTATSNAGTTRITLSRALSNFGAVNGDLLPDDLTPSQQIKQILQESRQSLLAETPSASNLRADLFDTSETTGTTASVHAGALLTAGGDVVVQADTGIELNAITGSGAAALAAAVGAAISVGRTHLKTDASFEGIVVDAENVTVQANLDNESVAKGFAGVGAIGAALGAAVTSLKDESSTTARLDGSSAQASEIRQADAVVIEATSSTNLETVTGQGSVAGGAAVGVTVSKASSLGQTQALVGDQVLIGQTEGTSVGSLKLKSTSVNSANANATALAAGVGLGAGLNFATAETSPVVVAALGTREFDSVSRVKVLENVDVNAQASNIAQSKMFGVNLSANAALGFGRALSVIEPEIESAIGRDVDVEAGGNVTVEAIHNRPRVLDLPFGGTFEITYGATANAEAGAAGAIAGNTARALTEVVPVVDATIYDHSTIVAGNSVRVQTEAHNNATALGGALTVGLGAAGGVQSSATIEGLAAAKIRNSTTIQATDLDVRSNSFDRAVSEGVAATGGIVSGNAVTSSASIFPATRGSAPFDLISHNSQARLDGVTVNVTGNVNVVANQVPEADAFAKGIAIGALLSAGTSEANVFVNPRLQAELRTSSVTAGGNLTVETNVGDLTNPAVEAMDIVDDNALAKDEISLAFAKGSGGALIGINGSRASTVFNPMADAAIRLSDVDATNVTVSSDASSSAAAVGRNVVGGLVAVGSADATLDMKDDLSATIGGTAEDNSSINAVNNVTVRVDSDQIGDAFSNTRAVAGFPIGRATTIINGTFELDANVGEFVDIEAGSKILVESEVDAVRLGAQENRDPDEPTNGFNRPNYIGANANADTGGLSANSFATAVTMLGTKEAPATSAVSVGSFSQLAAPIIIVKADVNRIDLKSDANARSAGARIVVDAKSTGEVHSRTHVELHPNSLLDGNDVTLEAINGSTAGIRAEVESTTDKDGILGQPAAEGTIRMDTNSTIDGQNSAQIKTRDLTVRTDTNVVQFDLNVLDNDTPRAGTGHRVTEFIRDRNIHWNADVVLKGAPSPTLIVEANGATGATVTTAVGVTIQDTDGSNPFDSGTMGNVAAPTIIVNPIVNDAAFGDILFEIPRRIDIGDTGTIDGNLGSFTVLRGFDEVRLENKSNKPMTIGPISVLNMRAPEIVVNAPISSTLSFPVFQDFGDTHIDIANSSKSGSPLLTLNGLISNPVGETEITSAGALQRASAGKILSNVVELQTLGGNVGSNAQRIPVEIVVSDGRQEDLRVASSGTAFLDLMARDRRAESTPELVVDASEIVATNANNLLLRTSVRETTLPLPLPGLNVNEVEENDVTFVVSFFETSEEIIDLDLGALAVNPAPVNSTWDFGALKGAGITANLSSGQLTGPLLGITANTDVRSGSLTFSTNGDINLTETAGNMPVASVTSTNGDVTLNSNSSLTASPIDTAADVVGNQVLLNAATNIGTISAPIDVNSNRLGAVAGGNIFISETSGSLNVTQVQSNGGDVSLKALNGSILDVDQDTAADVVGNNISLTANAQANSSIGTQTDALEIDSAHSTAGSVRAQAAGNLFIQEVAGGMTLAEARSNSGNLRVDVLDSAGAGENLVLTAAQVVATQGQVQLNAGDNFTSDAGSTVQGLGIQVVTDFGNADPNVPSAITAAGSYAARPIVFSTGSDDDSVLLDQTSFQGPVVINVGNGHDSITVDRIAPLTTQQAGVRDTLTMNLGAGDNVASFLASATGNYIANINGEERASLNTLNIQGTAGVDGILLNPTQLAIVHPGSPATSESILFGDVIDQLNINSGGGNDTFGINLATGNLEFSGGVQFDGGAGNELVLVSGSDNADVFEVTGTSPTAGVIRTSVNASEFSQPITITNIEQLSINGLNPTTSPGDVLSITNAINVVPVLPTGTLTLPLPVIYTNIEQLTSGATPVAENDTVATQEDVVLQFNPFSNDSGLEDLPISVVLVQPAFGSVVYTNAGTPFDLSDDRFVFTPAANFSGATNFEYTVSDVQGQSSTAIVTVNVLAVVDEPRVEARDVSGVEGRPIQLEFAAALGDTDGSEVLEVRLLQVPDIATLVDDRGGLVGQDLGDGVWNLRGVDLGRLFIILSDDGRFELTVEATAREQSFTETRRSSASFVVDVTNAAPAATIMEAPDTAAKNEPVEIRMAAVDNSAVDQASGFLYRVNWGDGSAIELVQGQPGVGPTLTHTYAESGIFTVRVTATDKDGAEGTEATHPIRVSVTGVVPDPLNPGMNMLVVEGTSGDDSIEVSSRRVRGERFIDVVVNNVELGSYESTLSRLVVYGLDGDDSILVSADVGVDSWLFGGAGHDLLMGGSGNNVLSGGAGYDLLRSRGGRDLLFGGSGVDLLFGGSGQDILLAGSSLFDIDETALMDIQRQWTGQASIQKRIDLLTGAEGGGLNGDTLLRGQGNNRTAFDDQAVDILLNDRLHDWLLANSDESPLDGYLPAKYFEEIDAPNGESEEITATELAKLAERRERALLDINGDGFVSPLDALLIINDLNARATVGAEERESEYMLDTNQDLRTTPLDVLRIVNWLNTAKRNAEGESVDNEEHAQRSIPVDNALETEKRKRTSSR